MLKRVKIAAACAATLALMGADGGCDERKGHVASDRNPTDRQVDPAKQRVVTIRVEGEGPYELFVHASEDGKKGSDQTREQIAGGKYKQTLTYSSGVKVRIRVNVTGHERDMFRCEIDDGPGNTDWELSRRKAYCNLVTAR